MAQNRRLVPVVVGSVAVIAIVATIIALAVVPLPEFPALAAGEFTGRLAFVDEDNCVHVANLETAAVREIYCEESEQVFIDRLTWTDEGLGFVFHTNVGNLRFIDPETGAVLSTEEFDETKEREAPDYPSSDVFTDREGEEVILRDGTRVLVRFTAPDRYWIEFGIERDDGVYAVIDSQGRLAVLRADSTPKLVAEDVRPWGAVAWEPLNG